MTWREDIDDAGQTLAQLLTDGGRVDPVDLDGALSARRAVLDLARAVHLDVTGLGTRSAVPTLAGLHEHPVRTFGQLLVRQPQPAPERALSDIVSHRPRSDAGTRWQALALQTTLASHAWSETPPQHRPSGHQAWTALNHVAALVHAVTVLDEDLAVSADRAGRSDLADQMRTAATSGLSEAANVVRALAAAGPLPDLIDPPEPAARRLMPVRDLDDLAPALTALAEQVRAARHLSPAHTQAVAGALARIALTASRELEGVLHHRASSPPQTLPATLHEHATRLTAVVSTPRRAETIYRSDPLPQAQATEITRWLTTHRPPAQTPGCTQRALSGAATALGAVTTALETTVRREHLNGNWLVPSEDPGPLSTRLAWMPPTPTSATPPLLRTLGHAADHAQHLATAGTPTQTAAATARQGLTSTQALTDALTERASSRQRPARPAVRPLPSVAAETER